MAQQHITVQSRLRWGRMTGLHSLRMQTWRLWSMKNFSLTTSGRMQMRFLQNIQPIQLLMSSTSWVLWWQTTTLRMLWSFQRDQWLTWTRARNCTGSHMICRVNHWGHSIAASSSGCSATRSVYGSHEHQSLGEHDGSLDPVCKDGKSERRNECYLAEIHPE